MSDHDPLSRQMEDEPRFTLLARDPTAADLVRLWVALRRRDGTMVDAICKRLKDRMRKLPYQPHKDQDHIQSATKIGNDMDSWLMPRAIGNIATLDSSNERYAENGITDA